MKQNIAYEMEHWLDVMKDTDKLFAKYDDQCKAFKIDKYFNAGCTIVDLGCGPVGGIFTVRCYEKMVCVDSLIDTYRKTFGGQYFAGREAITANFETFNLYKYQADGIICVNALDHSGELSAAINNIHDQLRWGGVFILGIHLRTSEQLNAGHKKPLAEKDVDKACHRFDLIDKEVTPAHGKHPAWYKGWFRK